MSDKTPSLKVFHERHLEELLTKLGLLEKLQKRELLCYVCKKIITMENFGAVFKKNGKVLVVCDDPNCIERVWRDLYGEP